MTSQSPREQQHSMASMTRSTRAAALAIAGTRPIRLQARAVIIRSGTPPFGEEAWPAGSFGAYGSVSLGGVA